jgi:hypothetical protein
MDNLIKMDGYDDCIMGAVVRFGSDPFLLYDQDAVIEKLMGEGMTHEEAIEFHEYNQLGAWVGDSTPAFFVKDWEDWE